MKLKTARFAVLGTLVLGIALAVWSFCDPNRLTAVLSIVMFVLSGMLQSMFLYCPGCKQPIRLWEIFKKECPGCGEDLFQ